MAFVRRRTIHSIEVWELIGFGQMSGQKNARWLVLLSPELAPSREVVGFA